MLLVELSIITVGLLLALVAIHIVNFVWAREEFAVAMLCLQIASVVIQVIDVLLTHFMT